MVYRGTPVSRGPQGVPRGCPEGRKVAKRAVLATPVQTPLGTQESRKTGFFHFFQQNRHFWRLSRAEMRFFKSHRSLNTPRGLLEMLFRVLLALVFSAIRTGTKAKRRDRGRFSPLSNRKSQILFLMRTVVALFAVWFLARTVIESAGPDASGRTQVCCHHAHGMTSMG